MTELPAGYESPGRPPDEALAWLREKGLAFTYSWLEGVWREEHIAAFTVAKAMRYDILSAIRAALDQALAEGKTFEWFVKHLQPELERLGWWGVANMVDPVSGERERVQLGSPARLRIIYDTNIRQSYHAGQWARIERTRKVLPYLLYTVGTSREHRIDHLAWHGLLLPVDDPFWRTHMPPNGWGCKCRTRQVSRREYERLVRDGVQAPPSEETAIRDKDGRLTGHRKTDRVPVRTEAPPIRTHEWINKRTGEILQVPDGIDPGFDWNPGEVSRQARAQELLEEKADALAEGISESLRGMGMEQAVADQVAAVIAAAKKIETPLLSDRAKSGTEIAAEKAAALKAEKIADIQAKIEQLRSAKIGDEVGGFTVASEARRARYIEHAQRNIAALERMRDVDVAASTNYFLSDYE